MPIVTRTMPPVASGDNRIRCAQREWEFAIRVLFDCNSGIVCFLFEPKRHFCDDKKIIDFIEDVGRHNAVDAIAGNMWLNDIESKNKIFYTTGRLTSEMVIKVSQMNIPYLISRSGITEMGLNVAKETGVTLIGRAKGKHFLVYNGSENIEFDDKPKPRPENAPDIWKRR